MRASRVWASVAGSRGALLCAATALFTGRVTELFAVTLRKVRGRLKATGGGDVHDGHGRLQQQFARAFEA